MKRGVLVNDKNKGVYNTITNIIVTFWTMTSKEHAWVLTVVISRLEIEIGLNASSMSLVGVEV